MLEKDVKLGRNTIEVSGGVQWSLEGVPVEQRRKEVPLQNASMADPFRSCEII